MDAIRKWPSKYMTTLATSAPPVPAVSKSGSVSKAQRKVSRASASVSGYPRTITFKSGQRKRSQRTKL